MNESDRQLGFDLSAARAARDRAIEQVSDNADDEWKQLAIMAVRTVAMSQGELTTDDLWKLVDPPHEPRAAGAIMQMAKRLGYCEPTDRSMVSSRVRCHARPLRVWRSLLWRGEP